MAQLHVSAGDVPLRCITQGAPPFVGPLPPLELVASRPGLGNLAHLRFFDPAHFRAGNIHNKPSIWQGLLDKSPCSEVDLLEVIKDGVRVDRFFRPFRGNIKGQAYDSEHPPPIILKNSPTTAKFSQFVSDSIIQWVTAGVLAVWGPVDSVAPPRLVLPLTVEPSKPRLCHDERYLNLWIRDLPFKLDHLCDLPRYVLPGHFQSSCDDKSGYQHVLLHPSSQTYFGFQWHGFYFVFRTLPFGWKASAFIYHKLGLAVSASARSHGVPVSQYIDDRHVGQLFTSPLRVSREPSLERAKAAVYIMCYLLIEAGYFIGLDKSQLVPSTWVRFLGFVCDSVRQAFLVPEDKKVKFAALREDILSSPYVGLKTLQRFSGKVISFSLAIPGCKLYVRDVFRAISRLSGSTCPSLKVEATLRTKIEFWRFLDNWKDCLPWRTERHAVVTLYCDASKRAWGGTLLQDGRSLESRDYWIDSSQDINVLETRALLHSLLSFRHHLSSRRVDVHTDSLVLKSALANDGCKNQDINNVLKDIFDCCREFNFSLDVHYVPSSENPADIPSRKVSDIDCMLSERAWEPVERLFGPHTFDLMSLDSNCQRDGEGRCLPHFTPCATPSSCGINVFAQSLPLDHNLYVFPPFVLIAPLLKCMFEQDFHGAFTIIVPDLKPRRFWWALLQSLTVDRLLLGKKGEDGILLFPSQNSRRWYSKELQWDLWAFRCVC